MQAAAKIVPHLELRPAGPEDVPFLLGVYASTREEELKLVPWPEEQKSAFVRMQFHAQKAYYEANYTGAVFQIILADGEPAGRLYTRRTDDEIRVMDIAILPAFRNLGIGSTLLRQIQQQAAVEGRKVGIHVEVFNPAQKLYERLGFKRVSDRGVYHFLQWEALPAVA
jgi:ribosomal protein S18 acetylase RimI-like enzyme